MILFCFSIVSFFKSGLLRAASSNCRLNDWRCKILMTGTQRARDLHYEVGYQINGQSALLKGGSTSHPPENDCWRPPSYSDNFWNPFHMGANCTWLRPCICVSQWPGKQMPFKGMKKILIIIHESAGSAIAEPLAHWVAVLGPYADY